MPVPSGSAAELPEPARLGAGLRRLAHEEGIGAAAARAYAARQRLGRPAPVGRRLGSAGSRLIARLFKKPAA